MRKYVVDEINTFVKDLQEAIRAFEDSGQLYTEEVVVEIVQACDQLYVYLKKNAAQEAPDYFSEVMEEMDVSIEKICNGQIMAEEFYQNMRRALRQILRALKKVDVTWEVVFLPYKASMWDSFESVWREAFQDEKCYCTVAVLPYYTKKQDGSLSERISEKEQFPDYVPVIDADDYDFEGKQPDIIFIHNPYDGYNTITTVDPKYYSDKLKQFTKKLVYIPYFVAYEEVVENFCVLPALRFADVVVVESEEIAEQYRKSYMWGNKEKFVAWGSPKYDMVGEHGSIEAEEIPSNWKERIGGRKVILYNTHISPLLSHPKEAIKKIRYVINFFSRREDVVLLWRPHPLSISTLEGKDQTTKESYLKLVEEFIQHKKGIYDDTADLSRAIAIADAYMGDHSSLVLLFQKVGKPIFIQNSKEILKISDEGKRSVSFEDAYFDEQGFWFAASTHNGLYYYDYGKNELYFKGMFPDEEFFRRRLYSKVFFYYGTLIFIPFNARKIVEYDITDGTFRSTEIPIEGFQFVHAKFYEAVMEGDVIYIFPYFDRRIFCYDIRKKKLIEMRKWNQILQKYVSGRGKDIIFLDAKIVDGRIAAPHYGRNLLFFFDLKGERNEIVTIGDETDEGFSSLEIQGEDYYLASSKHSHICKYSMVTGQYTHYSYSLYSTRLPFYIVSILIGKTIYFLEIQTSSLFCMDLKNGIIQSVFQKSELEGDEQTFLLYSNLKSYEGDKIALFPWKDTKLRIFSGGKLDNILSIMFSNRKDRLSLFQTFFQKSQEMIKENYFFSIDDYIELVVRKEETQQGTDFVSSGKIIYENLLREGVDAKKQKEK